MPRKVLFAGDRLFMKFPSLEYFERRLAEADAIVVSTKGMDDAAFVQEAKDAAAIVVIARKIGADLIAAMEKPKLIMTLSVGYDCVDVEAATMRGIPVSNSPTYCSDDVANHAMALILSLSRKIHETIPRTRKAEWDYKFAKPVFNYRDKTLGIIGLGKIGRRIVPKAKGFGMRVAAYDPYLADDIFEQYGVERKYELTELLSVSDYITIHAPLTRETFHMVDGKAFETMKKSAFIVNTARGSIIEQDSLVRVLKNGDIAGAGIDVLETEPPSPDHPLLALENALVTPHIAWYSEESFLANIELGMDELVRVLNGQRPRFIVNPQIFGMENRRAFLEWS